MYIRCSAATAVPIMKLLEALQHSDAELYLYINKIITELYVMPIFPMSLI